MRKSSFVMTTILLSAMPLSALRAQDVPPEQAAFVQAIVSSRDEYDAAKNDLAKGGVRPKRADAICTAVSAPEVSNWIGTVYNLTTNGDGWGVLSVELEGETWVSTWNNSFSDTRDQTLIDPSSKLFEQLAMLEEGQSVIFSGEFIKDSNAADCFREQSMTMDGSMDQPEFVFVFSDVMPLP